MDPTQVTTLPAEVEAAAVAEAKRFAVESPTTNLREYLQGWMLSMFKLTTGRSEFYGEATAIVLRPDVLQVARDALREHKVQAAFAQNKSDFYESRDNGSTIDNPWITRGDSERIKALAVLMNVIALQAGGTGLETAPPEPLDFVVRHQLATVGRELATKTLDERLAEVAYSSDKINYVRLCFGCMEMEDQAIADGSYRSPEEILHDIQVAIVAARDARQASAADESSEK